LTIVQDFQAKLRKEVFLSHHTSTHKVQ